jgi:hypothetical protein
MESDVVQQHATAALCDLAAYDGVAVAIAAAGAVPLLVQLLGPGSSENVQLHAAGVLATIAGTNAENAVAAVDAGAVLLLVQLLGTGKTALAQQNAAGTLLNVARNAKSSVAIITAAGAIPALVQLRRSATSDDLMLVASQALAELVLGGAEVPRTVL